MKVFKDKGIVEGTAAPTSSDVYRLGTIWIDKTNDESYILTDVTAGVATWGQTLDSVDGVVDLEGDYILNDQTTTNMMSKGTVYRFDGVDDIVTVSDSAEITDVFANGGTVEAWIYPISDGEADEGNILAKWGASAGYILRGVTDDGTSMAIRFIREAATSDGSWTTGVVVPLSTWSHVAICYNDSDYTTAPIIYLNGVALALATSTAPGGTPSSDTGQDLSIGNAVGGARTFDGSIAGIALHNKKYTAAEVKDLISGNIPFKWQYGSQSGLNVSTCINGSSFPYDTFSGASATGFTAISTTTDPQLASTTDEIAITAGNRYRVDFDFVLNSGQAPSVRMRLAQTADTQFTIAEQGVMTTGSYSVVGDALVTDTALVVFQSNGLANYAVSNLKITPLGAVALYDQTSISETTWYDKANGNDGAVTGAEVLNQPENDTHKGIVVEGGFLNVGVNTTLTISGGEVTAVSSFHTIDTESAAATDDLDTINGGKAGDLLIVTSASSSRDPTLKDGTGNLALAGDFTLTGSQDKIVLVYAGSTWQEISRSDNG